jgi:hypothetical protein
MWMGADLSKKCPEVEEDRFSETCVNPCKTMHCQNAGD